LFLDTLPRLGMQIVIRMSRDGNGTRIGTLYMFVLTVASLLTGKNPTRVLYQFNSITHFGHNLCALR